MSNEPQEGFVSEPIAFCLGSLKDTLSLDPLSLFVYQAEISYKSMNECLEPNARISFF